MTLVILFSSARTVTRDAAVFSSSRFFASRSPSARWRTTP
jgi:hypothetical protein